MAEDTIFPVGENRDNLKLVAIDPSDTVASMVEKINNNFENIAAHGGGPAGIDGKDGESGIPGSQGAPGKDGKDGKDGVDGRDGRDGRDGTNGTNGNSGSGYTISYNSNAVIVCGDNWIAGDDNRPQYIEAPVKVYKDSIELKYGSGFSLKFKNATNLPGCIYQNNNILICDPKTNNTLTFEDGKPFNVEFTITIVGESMTFDCIWILTPIKGLISYGLELSSLVVNAKYRNDDWNPVPSDIYVYVRRTSETGSIRIGPTIFNNQGFAVYVKELTASDSGPEEYFGFDKSNPTSNGWRGPLQSDNFGTKAYCTKLDNTDPTQAIGVVLLMNGDIIDSQDIKIVYDGTLGIPVNSVLPMSETYMYMVTKANASKPQENDPEWKETSPVATDDKPWLWKKTTKVFGSNNVELYRFVSIDWIGSKGEDGIDANDKDYIYCRIDRELTEEELQHAEELDLFPSLLYISAPLNQNNPFDEDGNPQWTDDDPGPNDDWPYVYYAVSEFDGKTGVWGPYGHITFWNRYPKNTSNPYQLNLSNRIIEINCDEDNNTLYEKKIHENVTVLKEGPANIDYIGCEPSPTESRSIEINASLAGIDITVPEGTNLEQPIELLVKVSNNWDSVDGTDRFYIEDTITIKKNSTRAGADAVSYDIKSDSTAVAETDNGTFATGTFNNDIHIWVQKKVGRDPAVHLTESNNEDNLTLEITYTKANGQTSSVGPQELNNFDYVISQEKLKTMRGVITCTLKQGDDVWDTHTIGISTRGPQGDPGTSTIGYSIINTEAQYAVTTRSTPYTTSTDKNVSWADTYKPDAGKYIHKRYRHTLSDTKNTKLIPETGYYYEVIGYTPEGIPGEPGTTFYTWILYCTNEYGGGPVQLSQTDASYKYKYSWYNIFKEPQPNNVNTSLSEIKEEFPAYNADTGDKAWFANPKIIKEMIGAGDTGNNIPTVFVGNWVSGQVYIGNDERRDIVWYTYMLDDKLVTKAYITKIGVGRTNPDTPPNINTSQWTEFGDVKDSIAAKLLLAESANIAGFQFNRLYGQYVLRSQEGIGKTPTLSSDSTTYINNGEYTPNIYINGTRGIITAGATTTIDGNGLTIKNINGDAPQTVFSTDTNGNISMTGEINATGGVFNGDVQAKTFALTPADPESGMEGFRAWYKFESVNIDGKKVLCPVLYWTNPDMKDKPWFLNLAAIKGLVQSSHYNYEDNWFRDADTLLDENPSCLVPVDMYKNSDDNDRYYILSGGEYKLANTTYYKQIDQPYGSRMAIVELENQYREWQDGSSAAYNEGHDNNGKVYLMIPINVYEQHTFSNGNDTYSSTSPSYIFTSTAKFSMNQIYYSSLTGRGWMKVEANYGQRNRIYFKSNYIYGSQAYNIFEVPNNSSLFMNISGDAFNISPSSSNISNPFISKSNENRHYALFQYGKGSPISDYKLLYTSGNQRCYYLDFTYNAHSDELRL